MFPITTIPDEAATQSEQLGTKRKIWFRDEAGVEWLFKEGRPGTGENWAEKVASELCRLLDLPHAAYEFALWKSYKGVVTKSFVPEGARLVLGNELLAVFIGGYKADRFYKQTDHTIRAVMTIMRSPRIKVPEGAVRPGVEIAADVFVGYLMFDALIGNTDRHHENWALIVKPSRTVELAPTYDHASSLGRNESDPKRTVRLTTRDKTGSVEAYARKARSAFFRAKMDQKPLSTMNAFLEAARMRPQAAHFWLDRLKALNCEHVKSIFDEVPRSEMSDVAAEFAMRLLTFNKDTLLALRSTLPA